MAEGWSQRQRNSCRAAEAHARTAGCATATGSETRHSSLRTEAGTDAEANTDASGQACSCRPGMVAADSSVRRTAGASYACSKTGNTRSPGCTDTGSTQACDASACSGCTS